MGIGDCKTYKNYFYSLKYYANNTSNFTQDFLLEWKHECTCIHLF